MATTQDTENSGTVDSDESTDSGDAQIADFEAVKQQLNSEVDAIDKDIDKLKKFILTLHFQQGINHEVSSAVQQVVRNTLNALISEEDKMTSAEAGDAL